MSRARWVLVAGFVVLFLVAGTSTVSALYVWKDSKGVTHISEFPDPSHADEVTERLKYQGREGSSGTPQRAVRPEEEEQAAAPPPERPPLRFAEPEAADPEVLKGRPFPSPSATAGPEEAGAPEQAPPPAPLSPEAQRQMEERSAGQAPMSPEEQRELQEAFKQIPGVPPGFDPGDQEAAGAVAMIMAMLAGFLFVIGVVALFAWVFGSLCLFLIAKKLDVENPWIAWIPLAQTWTFVQCAGKPWWWLLLLWIGSIIFAPVGLVVGVILWVSITENLGLNKWLGLLTLVPFVNLGFMGYLAFSKSVMPAGGMAVPGEMPEGFAAGLPAEEAPYGEDVPPDMPPDIPDLPPEESPFDEGPPLDVPDLPPEEPAYGEEPPPGIPDLPGEDSAYDGTPPPSADGEAEYGEEPPLDFPNSPWEDSSYDGTPPPADEEAAEGEEPSPDRGEDSSFGGASAGWADEEAEDDPSEPSYGGTPPAWGDEEPAGTDDAEAADADDGPVELPEDEEPPEEESSKDEGDDSEIRLDD